VRQLNALTRESLLQFCRDEGLLVERPAAPNPFLPVAIRSFLGPAADIVGAAPEDTLILTDVFRQRYLQDGRDWQRDIRPQVEEFLREAVKKSPKLRLVLGLDRISRGRGAEREVRRADATRAKGPCGSARLAGG
jgi:hypothetical protein